MQAPKPPKIKPVKLLYEVRRSVSEILGRPFSQRIDHQVFKPDQKILAAWAAECAERVLPLFESNYPDDGRPRRAIAVLREWLASGVFSMAVIRPASLGAHAAAKGKKETDAVFAAHAAGQAVGTAHVVTHALGAALYTIRAVAAHSGNADDGYKERDWQLARLREIVRHRPMPGEDSGTTPSISNLITILGQKGTARFKAAKELQLISQTNPALLYPHFQVFAQLLDNPSSVLLWNGIIILAHLVKVDNNRLFDGVFEKYYAHLWDGKLVTAANILGHSGLIIRYRPDLGNRIMAELRQVETIPLPTAECREVARGCVLASLAECYPLLGNDSWVHDFIVRGTTSHRPSVKKKAESLLGQMGGA